MTHPLRLPSAKDLRKRMGHAFKKDHVLLARDTHILFVCGGTDKSSIRAEFCKFAENHLKSCRIFLAELAIDDIKNSSSTPTFENLAELEELISDVSDCVLIFPESPGSYAELGYFSKHPKLIEKLLAASPIKFQNSDSFLNLGPIDLINRKSIFRHAIYMPDGQDGLDYGQVSERLTKRLGVPGQRRTKLDVGSYKALSKLHRLALVAQLIWLTSPVDAGTVEFLFRSVVGRAGTKEVLRLVSLLVAGGYVKRASSNMELLSFQIDAKPFLEATDSRFEQIKMEVGGYYLKAQFEASTLGGASI